MRSHHWLGHSIEHHATNRASKKAPVAFRCIACRHPRSTQSMRQLKTPRLFLPAWGRGKRFLGYLPKWRLGWRWGEEAP